MKLEVVRVTIVLSDLALAANIEVKGLNIMRYIMLIWKLKPKWANLRRL